MTKQYRVLGYKDYNEMLEHLQRCYDYLEEIERDYQNWTPIEVKVTKSFPTVKTLSQLEKVVCEIREESRGGDVQLTLCDMYGDSYYEYLITETEADRDERYQSEKEDTYKTIKEIKDKLGKV